MLSLTYAAATLLGGLGLKSAKALSIKAFKLIPFVSKKLSEFIVGLGYFFAFWDLTGFLFKKYGKSLEQYGQLLIDTYCNDIYIFNFSPMDPTRNDASHANPDR